MSELAPCLDPDLDVHISRRYRIVRCIGSGGMADVYLADDLLLERPVAVKVLHACHRGDAGQLERARREAKMLAAVTSPHVVGIHDFGVASECPYLVMQYLPGRTLADAVEQDGPMAPVRAGAILNQVLEGLVALHARGLVHRDIKPSNVMIDARDHVVLLDVGIAIDKQQRRITKPGFIATTPGYSAPECVTRDDIDVRSDLYQVGLLLVYLLTGVDLAQVPLHPFIVDHLSAPYSGVVRRALSTIDGRYVSATEMARAVDEAREGCSTAELDPQHLAALIAEDASTAKLAPLEKSAEATSAVEPSAPLREAATVVLLGSVRARHTPEREQVRREMMPALQRPLHRYLTISFWTPVVVVTIMLIVMAMVVG
jgi:serine/threonine protein kinase